MSFTPSIFDWKQVVELGYADDGSNLNDDMASPVCFNCGKEESETLKLNRCSKCHVATYCSKECQVANWSKGAGGGHKYCCEGQYNNNCLILKLYLELSNIFTK
jgi:sulfatase maturation enzyme AslB (radical SAM superfamily)